MVYLGHCYQMSVYQLLEDKHKSKQRRWGKRKKKRGAERWTEWMKKMKKDLSQLVGHKEGRSVSFGLHVSHVGCSGGVDMVGRKHLEGKITTSSNGEKRKLVFKWAAGAAVLRLHIPSLPWGPVCCLYKSRWSPPQSPSGWLACPAPMQWWAPCSWQGSECGYAGEERVRCGG